MNQEKINRINELARKSKSEGLTPAEKELMFLLYYENRTERELAEQYGVCRNAIHKRKIHVLKKLKNFLEG